VRLRWQLVLSHLGSILAAATLIGMASMVLLLRGTHRMEQENLQNTAATASQGLAETVTNLDRARDGIATALTREHSHATDLQTLGRLHDLLVLYRVERLEVFRGLHKEVEAYRWERGSHSALATLWLPANPSLAAQVAGGRPTLWVQRSPAGIASLKFCTQMPPEVGEERRWLVLTEPLDGTLLAGLIPTDVVGGLTDSRQVLIAWPETPSGGEAGMSSLMSMLPRSRMAGLFDPLTARSTVVLLDDGSSLDIILMAWGNRSGEIIFSGLRALFLILAVGSLFALLLGTGLARRLVAPLNALLEGTAAMARGHFMVRLPTKRQDELGSLMREFNLMADEIRNAYLGVISVLAEAVEAKSHYTREHIDRVESLTMATAEALERRGWVRFSNHQKFLLSVAAILHDVGKIAITNEILNKQGPLDGDERQQILSHPEVGALIVERIGKLERSAHIIRCAHEHFDGGGYPHQLRGEEIPIESRIILAVDAFDAMTIDRPYSVGRPLEAAIAELRRESGKQFDPVVVEALIEVLGTAKPVPARTESGWYHALRPDSDETFSGGPSPAARE